MFMLFLIFLTNMIIKDLTPYARCLRQKWLETAVDIRVLWHHFFLIIICARTNRRGCETQFQVERDCNEMLLE